MTSGDGGVLPRGLPVGLAVKGLDGRWRAVLASDAAPVDFVRILLFQDFAQLSAAAAAELNKMPVPPPASPMPAVGVTAAGATAPAPATTAPKPPVAKPPAATAGATPAPKPAAPRAPAPRAVTPNRPAATPAPTATATAPPPAATEVPF